MGVDYTIDRSARTVFLTVTGQIDLAEIADVGRRLRADPGFDPAFQELLDLEGMAPPDLHYPDLYLVAHEIDPFPSTSRRALVAPGALAFGLARMYQLIHGDDNIHVFRSRPEAMQWLGLSVNDANPARQL